MTILRVERMGDDLVVRLTREAQAALGLRDGDTVSVVRSADGGVSLAAPDIDHQLRAERSRAVLRRLELR